MVLSELLQSIHPRNLKAMALARGGTGIHIHKGWALSPLLITKLLRPREA